MYVIEFYDELSHRVLKETATNYMLSCKRAREWEKKQAGFSAVVSRVLYNSNYKDKWTYKNDDNK